MPPTIHPPQDVEINPQLAWPLLAVVQRPGMLEAHASGIDIAQLLQGLSRLSARPRRLSASDRAATRRDAAAPAGAAGVGAASGTSGSSSTGRWQPSAQLVDLLARFVAKSGDKLSARDVPMVMRGLTQLRAGRVPGLWEMLAGRAAVHTRSFDPMVSLGCQWNLPFC